MEQEIIQKAKTWLQGNFDEETKKQVQYLIDNDPAELTDAFYRELEFGTGGLRGIMGAGTNRMNKYTVGMATQGLANYLLKECADLPEIKVAIAYDSRNNSRYFAQIAADVLSGNGIKVFLFDDLRPTPELSFSIRHLGCQSGIVITASHNPKEYNGYKVYWDDGGQLVPPHDKNVITEVQKIKSIDDVRFTGKPELTIIIGEEVDAVYEKKVKSLSLSPEVVQQMHNMKIVYTPIHGSGIKLIPRCLKAFGFTNVTVLESQQTPDGNFPTVKSPNPEEPDAMRLALEKAVEINADIVLASDPDADRVGVGVKNHHGKFVLLNGNQTASVLIYYLLEKWKQNGKITGKEFIVKTIVTSELLKEIALKNGVESYDVLTGFKYIAEIIKKFEGQKTFIGGGEESYGYLVGDFVRDKDAVISCCMIAEAAAWAVSQKKSFFDILLDMYCEYGFYLEKLLSLTRKGKTGAEEIAMMMQNFRTSPPETVAGLKVVKMLDYKFRKETDMLTGKESDLALPKSDVIQFFLKDGSKITARPSGTEPKIKFYFGIKGRLKNKPDFDEVNRQMEEKINAIIDDLRLK